MKSPTAPAAETPPAVLVLVELLAYEDALANWRRAVEELHAARVALDATCRHLASLNDEEVS